MTTSHGSPGRAAPSAPFAFVGGEPCLDFVNTVDWTTAGLANERLIDYAALTRWAERAGLVAPAAGARLRRRAARSPAAARDTLAAARRLRGLLQRVFTAVAARRDPRPADVEALTGALVRAHQHLAVDARNGSGGPPLRWTWRAPADALGMVLWPVVRGAAALLTSDDARRLRVCAAMSCGWMYVDRSRNGLRRWCEMRTCGARTKARRYYARHHRGRTGRTGPTGRTVRTAGASARRAAHGRRPVRGRAAVAGRAES